MDSKPSQVAVSIWWFAFGYFAAYAPYSALTKWLSKAKGIAGFELLPSTAFASLVSMIIFLSVMRWWKYAGRKTVFGVSIPCPGRWTFLSGLCTAAIIPTTTLAYTFGGISIVFMMLLMRGGVLIIAPVVDFFSGRKVSWYSWTALGLTIAALFAGFSGKGSYAITALALVNLAIYLLAYFIRLRFMSRLAKSDDENARTRYFVEEQMVATPALVLTLAGVAFLGDGEAARATLRGFTSFLTSGLLAVALVVGVLSQFTGIFGGLILLDKRENTYCVPVNRASSVLAGLVATWMLWQFAGERGPATSELWGAGLIIAAIAVLSVPPLIEKKLAARRAARQGVVAPLPQATTGQAAAAEPRATRRAAP